MWLMWRWLYGRVQNDVVLLALTPLTGSIEPGW